MKRTPELVAEAQGLRDSGLSYAKIGKQLGINSVTVRLWLNPEFMASDKAKRDAPDSQARRKAYRSSPESKAKVKARQDATEYKAKQKAYRSTQGAKAKQKAYRSTTRYRAITCLDRSRVKAKSLGHVACTATLEELVASMTDVCEICGRKESSNRHHMDHCHKTGRFRGWLCQGCNTSIGRFNDDPILLQRALDYVKKFT